MAEATENVRPWDAFLTDRDRAHLAASPKKSRYGFGKRAAVLSVDNYRKAIGDERQDILDAIQRWPSSTGHEGWDALDRITTLFDGARAADVPIIHITGLSEEESGVAPWGALLGGRHDLGNATGLESSRPKRAYEIVPQAAPLPGEAVLKKTAPSAFFGTPLAGHLISMNVDTVIVCGEAVSGCIRATVVDARSYRFRVIVVEDCVYDRHQATWAMNLFDMDQKYADVVGLSDVLDWFDGARA